MDPTASALQPCLLRNKNKSLLARERDTELTLSSGGGSDLKSVIYGTRFYTIQQLSYHRRSVPCFVISAPSYWLVERAVVLRARNRSEIAVLPILKGFRGRGL